MTVEQVLSDIAPKFDTVDPSRRTRMIGYATVQVDEDTFGSDYELAIAYLTAHMFEIADRAGSGGQITGKKEGDLSLNFAASASNENELVATSYGQQYVHLMNIHIIGPRTFYGCGS